MELVEDMKLPPGILVRLIFFFSEADSGGLVCAGVEIGVRHSPDHLEVD